MSLRKLVVPWGGECEVDSLSGGGKGQTSLWYIMDNALLISQIFMQALEMRGNQNVDPSQLGRSLCLMVIILQDVMHFSSTCKVVQWSFKISLWWSWRCFSKNNFNSEESIDWSPPYSHCKFCVADFDCMPLSALNWLLSKLIKQNSLPWVATVSQRSPCNRDLFWLAMAT